MGVMVLEVGVIRVFYGDDRVKISEEVRRIFGAEYEVMEGEKAEFSEVLDACVGMSLFGRGVNGGFDGGSGGERKILIKDLSKNTAVWEKFCEKAEELLDKNAVIVWEEKFDKRLKVNKDLIATGVEVREFKMIDAGAADAKLVFEILDVAMVNGKRGVEILEKIEKNQDPFMLVGLFATQAIKKYGARQGVRERELLAQLAKLDMDMKSSSIEPMLLVKGFLLELGNKK